MSALLDKIKGKAKELEGRLTGDRARSVQGHLGHAKGELKAASKHLSDRAASMLQAGRAKAQARANRAR